MFKLFKKKKIVKEQVVQNHPTTTAQRYGPPITREQEVQFERDRKIISLQKSLEELKQKIDLNYKKIDQKQYLIKQLIRDKRKAEAKRHLLSLKQYQEEVAKQENMAILLEKTKIQLEGTHDTTKIVDALRVTTDMQKEVERNRDYLEDFMLDKKEQDMQNAEIAKILNDIAEGDQEEKDEIDKMYAEMENMVIDENIARVNKDSLKNVQKPKIVEPIAQGQVMRNNTQKKESSIDDLLAEAVNYA